ncbi:site-specific integrase [Hyphomonas sp.]|uniref:site-specific integrase n=1 Tax=Hyphomonas sp. TaxID=87 RepID=UPI0025BCCB1B|nr:site-specific integrase [Hyphomonas sp.]MBI1400050.1 tyrosine-type recombinase/integrase [Hyphomonas sp.]
MANIRKRGDRWQVQIRRQHAPNVTRSFIKRADAEAWGREMEVEADRRCLKHDPRILDRITLGELVVRYRDEVCEFKKSRDVERTLLNAFLRHRLAKRPLSQVTAADFAKYRDERLRNISASGLNREFSPLQHMYEIALSEWGLPLIENPLKRVRKPQNNRPRTRRLRDGEYERLLAAAEDRRVTYLKPIIVLAVETAMRRGEILAAKRCHLGEGMRSLHIPETKTGVPRTIPLSAVAREQIASLDRLHPDSLLFNVSSDAFKLTWTRTVAAAELEDLHFHDLRHEAVSRLFERGLSMPEVASISGHRDFRMLARYAHVHFSASDSGCLGVNRRAKLTPYRRAKLTPPARW